MAEIRINRDDGVAAFEKHLATGSLGSAAIVIPKDLTEGGAMGVSLAFAQFLLTWSRASSDSRVIKTYLSSEGEQEFGGFATRAHNLAAAYFSDKLLADKTEADIRHQVLRAAAPRIQAMYRADLDQVVRGPEIEMVLVQDAMCEFHGAFYTKAPSPTALLEPETHGRLIRNQKELNQFVSKCAEKIHLRDNKGGRALDAYFQDDLQPFGCLLYEAFRNTAEHGYLAADGSRLKKNLRCVKLARSMSSRERIAEMTVSAPQSRTLADGYFNRIAQGTSSAAASTRVQFFEMSIFDSGPGFSATMQRSEDQLIQTDVEAVAKCFKKHMTAKSSPMAGWGLNRMLGVTHKMGGFLRVRTSTVEAFFAAHGDLVPDTDPLQYVHGGLSRMEGTLVTVGIPMTY